jgi:hypothetical protein
VTGVQTCALPIWLSFSGFRVQSPVRSVCGFSCSTIKTSEIWKMRARAQFGDHIKLQVPSTNHFSHIQPITGDNTISTTSAPSSQMDSALLPRWEETTQVNTDHIWRHYTNNKQTLNWIMSKDWGIFSLHISRAGTLQLLIIILIYFLFAWYQQQPLMV